eukprot:COSAG04_NODE_4146_length_2271_cov_10.059392_1_plen_221_part_10
MHRVTTLKLPQQEEAQKLMEKVAWQVEPIMRKHQWSVPVFAEFLPRGAGLLGLNHNRGQKIQVRLRQNKESGLMDNHGQSDPDAVYASALGTTLHELVHCKIGGASHPLPSPRAAARPRPSPAPRAPAHSAEFYKLLDELRAECDELEDKNIGGSGQGFDAVGNKASTTSHNPASLRDGRMAGAAAAEKRLLKRSLGMAPGGGGQRLGGARPAAVLPAGQM